MVQKPQPIGLGGLGMGDCYEPFFLRSAQRLFIANESRFLPSGVMPPRVFPLDAAGG